MSKTIQSLVWITDPHLEFLPDDIEIVHFAKIVQDQPQDAVLITGDISDAQRLGQALGTLAKNIKKQIFFVLGNHDRYGGSFSGVEEIVEQTKSLFPNLVRLTGTEIVQLNKQVGLIGIDGWACGTGGLGRKTKVRVNDDHFIEDLRRLPSDETRFDLMFKLAQGYTEQLRPTLRTALSEYDQVIIATHVPPFVQATWHEGNVSGLDYLPLFSSPVMGEMIKEEAERFPQKTVRIYCGHTHSGGFFETANIKCWTGGARYYYPEIQGSISA